MTAATRVFALDDHPLLARGLEVLFDPVEDIELVGCEQQLEPAAAAAAELRPDVLLVDVRMPGTDGVTALGRLAAAAPGAQPVMFSAYADRRLLADALAAGARGYVSKASPADDLIRAVRAVSSGRPFVDPSLSPLLLLDDAGAGERPISERERELLRLFADGHGIDEVARRLVLGPERVKADARRLAHRLGAQTRVAAVATAVRRGLID